MPHSPNRLNVLRACYGETRIVTLTVKDWDGREKDLSAATMYFTANQTSGSTTTTVITKSGTLAVPGDFDFTNAATGVIVLTLTTTDTAQEVGAYRYDMWFEDTSGRYCVVSNAQLWIDPSITVFP